MIFSIDGEHSDNHAISYKIQLGDYGGDPDSPYLWIIIDETTRKALEDGKLAKESKTVLDLCKIRKVDLKRIAKAI